jgi:CheY-like chemotaxis protein
MMRRLSILYVDDNPDDCKLIEMVLGAEYDVTVATSVLEAVALLNREKFNAVLSDLNMPQASGVVIMAHCQTDDIPCAILTAQRWLRKVKGLDYTILDKCQLKSVPQWVRDNALQRV